MTAPELELNTHKGGSWTATMESAEGNRMTTSGEYKVLEPPSRLVFTFAWTQDDGSRGAETEIEITLAKSDIGTLMTLVQGTFTDMAARDGHNEGWTSSFNDLEKVLG